jgi:hypothetical protein
MFTAKKKINKQPPFKERDNRKIDRKEETVVAVVEKHVFPFCQCKACMASKMQAPRALLS